MAVGLGFSTHFLQLVEITDTLFILESIEPTSDYFFSDMLSL